MTIFDFADSASVGYAEGYQAGRIIEAPAKNRHGAVLRFAPEVWRRFAAQVKSGRG